MGSDQRALSTVLLAAGLAATFAACNGSASTGRSATEEPSSGAAGTNPARAASAKTADPPSKAAAPAEVATGVIVDSSFELRATPNGAYQTGELGTFSISLTGRSGWHVNEEYPIRVELTAPSGVALSKSALERADAAAFSRERARFDVPFTPAAAGEHRVEAKVSFAVCTDENCIPDERTLAVLLPVR